MTFLRTTEVQREQEFMFTADKVNKFILSTAQFLNRFAAWCDSQLFEVGRSLQRLEILTVLLEKKLDSVDGGIYELDDVSPPAALSTALSPMPPPMPGLSECTGTIHRPPPPPPPQRKGPPPPPGAKTTTQSNGFLTLPPPPALPGQLLFDHQKQSQSHPHPPPLLLGGFTMCTHPRLRGYFEMLALRVPIAAIKAKMEIDGHQPEWLDTPDDPAPSTLAAAAKSPYDSD